MYTRERKEAKKNIKSTK
uniref:Uncharacterized protein n=1 Tax=Anguilla anguilla TaxID=7936 RepID=A0A0E9T6G7_ANGAN